jgi:hypothetical protein
MLPSRHCRGIAIMKPKYNDLFRLVSLRASEPVFAVDPNEDGAGTGTVELLRDIPVDLENPQPEIRKRLAAVPVLSKSQLDGSVVAVAEAAFRDAGVATIEDLRKIRFKRDGSDAVGVSELAGTLEFQSDYDAIANSWEKLLLTNSGASDVRRHEQLIRAAHLAQALRTDPASLAEPDAVGRLRRAAVVPPHAWRPAARRREELRERHREELDATETVGTSKRAQAIKLARSEYADLSRRIETIEAIQTKARRTYFRWKSLQLAGQRKLPARRSARFLGGASLFGRSPRIPSPPTLRPDLDRTFYAELDLALSSRERRTLRDIVGAGNAPPVGFDHFADYLDPGQFIDDANRICATIRLWEDAESEYLPVAPAAEAAEVRPLVRAIGWGDLVVARERLIGYDAREIAHVENIMAGETKLREHERKRTVEEVREIETLRETESERDLQTTDRFELQSESQTTISQEYSIEAGVNTSGRYGLTQVETSLQAGFQQNKSEARSSSQQVAKEIVSKAVERTLERVRELRRLTITEQIRELNRHRLANPVRNGAGAAPSDISGIYLWLEKLLEVELRHYGTRMLVEFYIPEPALSLLEQASATASKPRKPAEFKLDPADIEQGNYMCLAEKFGAVDVQPPPAQYIEVGYAWASAPSEDVEGNTAEDTVADMIAIPAGYKPVDGYAIVSPHPAQANYFDVVMAVGGEVVIDWTGVDGLFQRAEQDAPRYREGELEFDRALVWPTGVPVSVRAHGHFDKTLVAQVTLTCERTAEALATWRLRTWEQLRNGHATRMQQYQREMEEWALRESLGAPPLERPEAENRRVEGDELRKWAIKAMRLKPFNFNAVQQVGDFQEIDPLGGDLEASVARLFEEGFEWAESSYFLFPYYWGRRDTWKMRMRADAVDARHEAFLRAGAARFIVPVTPGYEERVLYYLESEADELDRLDGPPDGATPPAGTGFENLWLELLRDRKPEIALGSGTLSVTNGGSQVDINDDSNWRASNRDLGRELYIDGEEYRIAEVAGPQRVRLDEPFSGATNTAASYATGSVPYGPPWVVRVPTSLVILNGRRNDLAGLSL